MDPVLVAAPIVLPVTVPMLATVVVPGREMPVKAAAPVLVQLMFWIVLPWMLLAVPVAVVTEMAVKALSWAVLVQAEPPHSADLPPM